MRVRRQINTGIRLRAERLILIYLLNAPVVPTRNELGTTANNYEPLRATTNNYEMIVGSPLSELSFSRFTHVAAANELRRSLLIAVYKRARRTIKIIAGIDINLPRRAI